MRHPEYSGTTNTLQQQYCHIGSSCTFTVHGYLAALTQSQWKMKLTVLLCTHHLPAILHLPSCIQSPLPSAHIHCLVLVCLPDYTGSALLSPSSPSTSAWTYLRQRRGGRIRDLSQTVSRKLTKQQAAQQAQHTHESPVSETKVLGQGVERQVVSRSLWVMVWAGHLGAGAVEATAGDHLGHWGDAGCSAGEHLEVFSQPVVADEDQLSRLRWNWGLGVVRTFAVSDV